MSQVCYCRYCGACKHIHPPHEVDCRCYCDKVNCPECGPRIAARVMAGAAPKVEERCTCNPKPLNGQHWTGCPDAPKVEEIRCPECKHGSLWLSQFGELKMRLSCGSCMHTVKEFDHNCVDIGDMLVGGEHVADEKAVKILMQVKIAATPASTARTDNQGKDKIDK